MNRYAPRFAVIFALAVPWLPVKGRAETAWQAHVTYQSKLVALSQAIVDATVTAVDSVVVKAPGEELGFFHCEINEHLLGEESIEGESFTITAYLSETDGYYMVPRNAFEPVVGDRYLMHLTSECAYSARRFVCPPIPIMGDSIRYDARESMLSWSHYRSVIDSIAAVQSSSPWEEVDAIVTCVVGSAGRRWFTASVLGVEDQDAGPALSVPESINFRFEKLPQYPWAPPVMSGDTLFVFARHDANQWFVAPGVANVLFQIDGQYFALQWHPQCDAGTRFVTREYSAEALAAAIASN